MSVVRHQAVAVSSFAHAEAPKAGAAYCVSGVSALELSSDPQPVLKEIYQACKVGDTIAIPASEVAVIAQACDFNKSIASVPTIFCVLAPMREKR
jgi:hypothetical protein